MVETAYSIFYPGRTLDKKGQRVNRAVKQTRLKGDRLDRWIIEARRKFLSKPILSGQQGRGR